MRVLVYVAIAIILSLFESAMFRFFSLEFLKPDLGLPVVIYSAIFLEPHLALTVTVFVGVFQEVLSGAHHGTLLFTKISLFLVTLFLKNKLYIDSRYSFAYICTGFVVLESFIYLGLSYFVRGDSSNLFNVLFYLVPNAVFTGFFSMFVLSLIETLNTRIFDERNR